MEKKNRRIYLTDPVLSQREIWQNFSAEYEIPNEISYFFYENVEKTLCKGGINYFCPHCEADLVAEWNFINRDCFHNRIEKGEEWDINSYIKVPCYYVHDVSYDGGVSSQKTKLKNFSDEKYGTYLQTLERINESFPGSNHKILRKIREAAEMTHCPVCGGELIKKYPFAKESAFSSVPKALKQAFSWKEEISRIPPWVLWDNNERLQEEYQRQGKKYPDFKEEWEEKEIRKVFDDPVCEKHALFMQQLDVPVPFRKTTQDKKGDFLREYLLNLINLETNIVCMAKRLEQLYLLEGKNQRDLAFEQNVTLYRMNKELTEKQDSLMMAKQKVDQYKDSPLLFDTVDPPRQPEKPEPVKAGLFNKKKVENLNAQAEMDYRMAMEKYHTDLQYAKEQTQKNKEAAQQKKQSKLRELYEGLQKDVEDWQNEQKALMAHKANTGNIPANAVGAHQIINGEIEAIEEALRKTFQCRNELYSYNIIFEKYRNLVAISAFYEYLMAGRCETLEGVNGAYNIFESECRMDAILTRLDEIKIKLDEIKENQYMIYTKLKSVESSLATMNRSMDKALESLESINANTMTMNEHLQKIANNTDVIAHNSVVSAYYSKVNAELTNALGFMMALS